jgi:amidohydrolase
MLADPAARTMPQPNARTLASLIQAELPSLVELRRDLHRHPELAFQESRTSAVVQRELTALGIQYKSGLARHDGKPGTGVLGYLPATTAGGNQRLAVGLRADMDALPIVEQTGKAYASCTPGVMHACGHDGHTTMLIGAARVLSKLPERPNPVAFVFQPAEEGGGGADLMCREGVLGGLSKGGLGNAVGRMFGLHGWPQLPLGVVASKPGPLLAAVDDFVVTVKGVQSHGAYPHFGRDAVLATAHIITALQSIASRNVGPLESVVVSIGAIHAGTANNIIPETVEFIGTVRTLSPTIKALARERFFAIVEDTARAFGCEAKIDWHEGYPVTSNDAEAAKQFFAVADEALGAARVLRLENPTMGGEDFAYYGAQAKACFFFLGLRPGEAEVPTLHQPDFDFNDDAIATGVELMARLAMAEA